MRERVRRLYPRYFPRDAPHPNHPSKQGGHWVIGATWVGQGFDAPGQKQDIERAMLERRRAFRDGTPISLLMRWRPDITMASLSRGFDRQGFDLDWIPRVTREEHVETIVRWREAGYIPPPHGTGEIKLHPDADPVWFQRVFFHDPSWNTSPAIYAYDSRAVKVLMFQAVATDLRNPDFRAYAVRHAKLTCEQFGADGLFVGMKKGFWRAPQTQKVEIGGNEGPGALFDTHYALEEFEDGFADLLLALWDAEIPVVTNESPSSNLWEYWTDTREKVGRTLRGEG